MNAFNQRMFQGSRSDIASMYYIIFQLCIYSFLLYLIFDAFDTLEEVMWHEKWPINGCSFILLTL